MCCCNAHAEQLGIKKHSSWATACMLSPDAKAIERTPIQEHQALQALARWCYQFTPSVSVETPDKLLLEIQGSLALFNGLYTLLKLIEQNISSQGYSLNTGLAHTPKAATLMSYSKTPPYEYIDQGLLYTKAKSLLNALPISALNTTEQLKAKLYRTGFESLDDVFRLPYTAAGKRYGKAFVLYLQQILGQISDPQKFIKLPEQFSETLHFVQGISETEALLFPIQRLLSSLCTYLRTRQLSCTALTWSFEQHSGQKTTLNLCFSQAQNDLKHFRALVKIKLENFKIIAPIESVTLYANNLNRSEQSSESLFSGFEFSYKANNQKPIIKNHKATQVLLDKLGARLSNDAVYELCIKDSHIPEYTWQAVPALDTQYKTASRPRFEPEKEQANNIRTNPRPAWLLNKPIPLQSKQHQLYWHGKLEIIKNPERIEGNWWQTPIQRDYFIARREDGTYYWVFQDRLTHHWFLQGLFG
ncbi:MAG: DNA polymerase Y family protein [Pseudomonadales bacterium]|nr:DNA polymerase Y family protein [Pseudomonadales bacterium]